MLSYINMRLPCSVRRRLWSSNN